MVDNFCKCGNKISRYSRRCKSCSNKGRKGKYHLSDNAKRNIGKANSGKNNYWYGKNLSKRHREKIGEANREEKNGMWKGSKVGHNCLHKWIKRHKPKPPFCGICKVNPPYDLANISGKYKRDINDFEWLCRGCHMNKDGRLKILITGNKERRCK